MNRRAIIVLGSAIAIFFAFIGLVYSRVFMSQGGRYLLTVGSAIWIVFSAGLLGARGFVERRILRRLTREGFVWAVIGLMVGLSGFVLWRSIYRAYLLAWTV